MIATRKPRIVFFGTPDFAVPSLQILLDRREDILCVVTQPDRPAGRGRNVVCSPVKTLAHVHGLPLMQPERVRDPRFIEAFAALRPDLAVVVAFGQIFPRELLTRPRLGCINVHASLLPAYRGAAPINHAIIDGAAETGITIMALDEGMDTGAIILQEPTPIAPDDTAAVLHDRLAALGARLLGVALDRLATTGWSPEPQDHARATYAPMLKKSDGLIDWSMDAVCLANKIRGMYPWPGCYTLLEGAAVKIHAAEVRDAAGSAPVGSVVAVCADGIDVATGRGVLRLKEVQRAGKKRLAAAEFLKGHPLKPGTRLGTEQ
jgi:methionyl-tRNA formyltransferase